MFAMDLNALTAEELVSMFSRFYSNNCQPSGNNLAPTDAYNNQAVDAAGFILTNHAMYSRDLTLLVLTSCRQCFFRQNSIDCQRLLHNKVTDSAISILKPCVDRFTATATRDLILSVQQFMLQDDVLYLQEHSRLMGLFNVTYMQSIESKEPNVIITCVEVISSSLSYLRKKETTPQLRQIVDIYIRMFNEHWTANLTLCASSNLVICALLKCLSKIAKISRKSNYGLYLEICSNQVRDLATISLSTEKTLLWRMYLHACKDIVAYSDRNYAGDTELQHSHWIIMNLATHALNNVPIPVGFHASGGDDAADLDVVLLRSVVYVVLMAEARTLLASSEIDDDTLNCVVSSLSELNEIVCRRLMIGSNEGPISRWFFSIFLDQDDAMSDCLIVFHDMYMFLSTRKVKELINIEWLNPWSLFSSLVGHLSHDHSVLLDLIISPETNFLQYFLSLLHYVISHWQTLAIASVLDSDLIEEPVSHPSVSSQVISLTSGFESLMAYNEGMDSFSEEGDDSCRSDETLAGSEPTLHTVLQVLDKVHQSLCQMNYNSLNPFNTAPLITLLDQIKALTY